MTWRGFVNIAATLLGWCGVYGAYESASSGDLGMAFASLGGVVMMAALATQNRGPA